MFFGAGYLVSNRSLMRPVTDILSDAGAGAVPWADERDLGVVRRRDHRDDPPRRRASAGTCLPPAAMPRRRASPGVNVGGVQAVTSSCWDGGGLLNSSRLLSAQPSDDFSFVFRG